MASHRAEGKCCSKKARRCAPPSVRPTCNGTEHTNGNRNAVNASHDGECDCVECRCDAKAIARLDAMEDGSGTDEGKRFETSDLMDGILPSRDTTHVSQVVATRDLNLGALSPGVLPSLVDLLASGRQRLSEDNILVCRMDRNGIVKDWNDAAVAIMGWSREEATEKPLIESFIMPELREAVKRIFEDVMGGNNCRFVMEARTKSNEPRFLLIDTCPVVDTSGPVAAEGEEDEDGGNVIGLWGYARDITREMIYDRSVSAMFHDHRMLVQTANAPIFGVDKSLCVSEWNEYCISITGFVTTEVIGKPFLDTLVVPSKREIARGVLERALLCGEGTADYELEISTKRGEIRMWRVSANPRLDPHGKVFGVIGVAQDVTDDRRLALMVEQMEISNKRKDEMLESERSMTAYFSHELRNPLHSIDSALQAMPDDLPESAKSLVNAMQLCTSFMSSVMNNLLDVRKIEEGKMTLNYEPMSLSGLVRTVLDMLGPSVRPGVKCSMNVRTEGKDWVLADAHRLQQVLMNVVTNAIKYTTEGSVTLRVLWEGPMVRFDCVDTGPGIPKAEQGKLFKKFVQRGGAPGSGLGLAIAKKIVDLGGGLIYFESDPTIRPGTTCVIKLPLRRTESPADAVSREVASKKVIDDPLSFLIIDDIEVNRTMLGRRLKKCIAPNARIIRQARTGEEAIKICRSEKFDVIVVDHHMDEAGGVMLGSDVAIAMRRMGIDDIIIGCSGDDPEAFNGSGCDLVWGKPMPPNATVVRQLLELLSQKVKPSRCLCVPQHKGDPRNCSAPK